jgi:defect-in-organelle-trafficking protein DotC
VSIHRKRLEKRHREDFGGMILYRKLLAMNMVSPPYVSNTDLGVTGDASEMHIDDRVLRITALPALNINSHEWKAAVAQDENMLEHLKRMEALAIQGKLVVANKTWKPLINPVSK